MPYQEGEHEGQSCIYKENADGSRGALVKGSCHADAAMTHKMFQAMNAATEAENKAAPAFALPATDEHPDKFPLGNKAQIEGAITSVMTGSFRGNAIKPALTDAEKSTAKANIRKAISASGESQDWKDQELARLEGKELSAKELETGAKWDDCNMPMPTMPMKINQDDPRVQYGPLLGTDTQACANCQWFSARNASCGLVWDDIVATGLCKLWLAKPTLNELQIPIPVVIVEPPATGSAEQPVVTETKESSILAWLKQTFGKKADEPLDGSGFKSLDDTHWVAYYTNSFEDKTGQIFSEKSSDQYIGWLDKGAIPLPELWYWHVPGTKHGTAQWVDRVDHINVAVGTYEGPLAEFFRKEYGTKPHKVSHTYGYPKQSLQDGVYHSYFTIEISPLPAGKEANEYTTFTEVKEMPITDEKKAKLEAILGKEMATQVLGDAEKMSKDLEALGIKFKQAEGLPAVDADAREVLQLMALANKEVNEAATKHLEALSVAVKALVDGEQARNKQVTDLVASVKELFSLQPRASQNPQTVVTPTDPMAAQAALLAAKQGDPNAQPNAPIWDQLAGVVTGANKSSS